MSVSIMLIDEDESYINPVEKKFIKELGEKAIINIITDRNYMLQYFQTPRHIDILIINKNMYFTQLEKHDIANMFFLSETDTNAVRNIFKYISVKYIFDYVINNLRTETKNMIDVSIKTHVIMFYSPMGGCGTTYVSNIAAKLIARDKKVLYISTEPMQSFAAETGCVKYMSDTFEHALLSNDHSLIDAMDKELFSSGCDYLAPIHLRIADKVIPLSNYIGFIDRIKNEKNYDYIILDTSSDFNEEKCRLMNFADKVVILTRQDKIAAFKLDSLMSNVDLSNRQKFVIACNMLSSDNTNCLTDQYIKNTFYIKCAISYLNSSDAFESADFAQLLKAIM